MNAVAIADITARLVDPPRPVLVVAAPTIPGLFDVQMQDGSWRHDLTTGQVTDLLSKAARA